MYYKTDCHRILVRSSDRAVKQLLELHDAVSAYLEAKGDSDAIGEDALNIPLLVASREFNELCPECGGDPGDYAGECVTCDEMVRANAPDRSDYE